MNWIQLTDAAQLDGIVKESHVHPVAIFKHSTRCSVSSMVKKTLERDWNVDSDKLPVYFLDLIAYRRISNEIADLFDITHESPQLILIKDGKAIYHSSHSEIDFDQMLKAA
ncbi:MAG: ytxJ [Bacteroidetes bacterium]|nr:ytxJ [Bacteroidota bacterium]